MEFRMKFLVLACILILSANIIASSPTGCKMAGATGQRNRLRGIYSGSIFGKRAECGKKFLLIIFSSKNKISGSMLHT